jgi:hypothetical protein
MGQICHNNLSHHGSTQAALKSLQLTGHMSKQLEELNCAFIIMVTVFWQMLFIPTRITAYWLPAR